MTAAAAFVVVYAEASNHTLLEIIVLFLASIFLLLLRK
jgi:hypothetical protein